MDLGGIIPAVLSLLVFAVFAGAVQQILEGELFGGLGFLALGVVLLVAYAGGAAIFNFDAIPVEASDIPGLENIPGVSEFLGLEETPTPEPTPAQIA